ncbi:hypothetical protein ABQJ54_07675 [Rhodanobacter sp. Si-c]|uniref:DUF4157 domain-containing protein n=1 Tax=Rhodanobacter lycopersici TaxID=3162487 RepID=A0ABV3QER9_9GAMM
MDILEIFPSVISWVADQQLWARSLGRPLVQEEVKWARSVGVEKLENVRVLEVEDFPRPSSSQLVALMSEYGFLGPDTDGITYGYSILIRRGKSNCRLLSHEFRHVYQYEQYGSIENFLAHYLTQIVEVGYEKSALEIDARKHELQDDNLPNSNR